jgi:hypothetical protein
MAAQALVDAVLQQAVHQDDVAAGEFVAARHLPPNLSALSLGPGLLS